MLDALRRVPRHAFVPQAELDAAYEDMPQPIGGGQTISQPTIVAIMTQALELGSDRTRRVLEVGTGCGYNAAVVSSLARHVFSVEVRPDLADAARRRLVALGYEDVSVRTGDGHAGWPEEAPFDRIVVTAAPEAIPTALLDQLASGGVLVSPEGPEGRLQRLVRVRRFGSSFAREDLGSVIFVPMVRQA